MTACNRRRMRDLKAILRASDAEAVVRQDLDGGFTAEFRPDANGPAVTLAIGEGRSPILDALFGVYPERRGSGTGAHP